MTLAEYLALNPTGNVAQYLDTKDQRVLGQGVGDGARPNFSRPIPLQQDQRFIDNVNAMPKTPPPMVPVPPASNFPRENVVPRVANQNDNPFTGGLTQNGMPLNEMTGRTIPGGEYRQTQPQQPITNQLPPSPMPRGAGVGPAITANRQPPQLPPPRRTPSKWDLMKESMFAGEDQRGLFGKAGGDRGSMGLSGFFGDLFNNPNRMAMLSGGLTALDPGSYYDKEGFSSPWTGLRSGLGGAQAGYKSVIDRRKAEAETALAKAKTTAEGQAKAPDVKSAQFGDHVYLYTDEAVEAVTKQIMRDEGLTREQAQRKAIPIAGTRMQKEVTPQQAIKNEKVRLKTQGRARMKLKELDNLEMLLRKSPIAGGELGGSLMDLVNIMSENILNKTAYKDRAEIDSIVDRMRPLLTKEFIEESRMSDYERQIVNEALGYTGVSSAKKKLRALPLIQRMLRETAGMTRQETTGGIVDKKEAYKKAFPNLPM